MAVTPAQQMFVDGCFSLFTVPLICSITGNGQHWISATLSFSVCWKATGKLQKHKILKDVTTWSLNRWIRGCAVAMVHNSLSCGDEHVTGSPFSTRDLEIWNYCFFILIFNTFFCFCFDFSCSILNDSPPIYHFGQGLDLCNSLWPDGTVKLTFLSKVGCCAVAFSHFSSSHGKEIVNCWREWKCVLQVLDYIISNLISDRILLWL